MAVAVAPLEILARYEAPFRAAGLNPGFVTTSGLAALELAPDGEMSVIAKIAGRTLSVLALHKGTLKVARCLEIASAGFDDITAVLAPTFVYVEDNLGALPDKLYLCGLGSRTDDAACHFAGELSVEVEPLRSPLAMPGEHDAGLLGYLHAIAKSN